MRQMRESLIVQAPRRGLHEITGVLAAWLDAQAVGEGLLTVFVRHTSASLLIQENADPDVLHDLEAWLDRHVPEDGALYRHSAEVPDDMPAHIKSALTQTHLAIPVGAGRMLLGTWQGVYLFEHRRRPGERTLILHVLGD